MRSPGAQEIYREAVARNVNRRGLGRLPSVLRLAGSSNLLASVADPGQLPHTSDPDELSVTQTAAGETLFRIGYSQIGGGHKVV